MVLLFGGDTGGEDALVGGEPDCAGQEATGGDQGFVEVDSVDGEPVRVDVVLVVSDPGMLGELIYEVAEVGAEVVVSSFPSVSSFCLLKNRSLIIPVIWSN